MTDLLTFTGIAQRAVSFGWRLLDIDNLPIGDLDVTDGASVRNDTTGTILRSVSGFTLPPSTVTDVDFVANRIAAHMTIDGAEYPLGVFLFGTPNLERTTAGVAASVSLVDQGVILDQADGRAVSYASQTDITAALQAEARALNIDGSGIDQIGRALSASVAWPPGTTTLKRMRDLCVAGGCLIPYFDNTGLLRVRQMPDPSLVDPDFSYGEGGTIIAGSIIETADYVTAPNRWQVIDGYGHDAPIVGVYDAPGDAPNSFTKLGFYRTDTITQQGITDVISAEAAAQAAAVTGRYPPSPVSFDAAPDPRHDTFNLVEYRHDPHLERGWTLPCAVGSAMTHDLVRLW